ncbi:unnamed protein product [Chondrus crispus]|uniref:Uncharacterized protein n=1 Tax=Chondrus crispus TaxID=2769 RepID=S0F3H8_CHOCR|nr:unnamed protein product [Chondrus crispus]CDF77409.1 unnamed protein product [Chondrus crispus]|eukprot:XP_005712283.1 unnamed protein product [Chondrus crispus]
MKGGVSATVRAGCKANRMYRKSCGADGVGEGGECDDRRRS